MVAGVGVGKDTGEVTVQGSLASMDGSASSTRPGWSSWMVQLGRGGGQRKPALVRCSVVDRAGGSKLAGATEELPRLPNGAGDEEEVLRGDLSVALLGLSTVCSGGKARRAEEKNRVFSGAERRKGGRVCPSTLSLKLCEAVVDGETTVGTAAVKLWVRKSGGEAVGGKIAAAAAVCTLSSRSRHRRSVSEADERAPCSFTIF
jgi:hypothetical protein